MTNNAQTRASEHEPRFEFLGWDNVDDSDGLTPFERQKYLDRFAAQKASDESGIRKISENEGSPIVATSAETAVDSLEVTPSVVQESVHFKTGSEFSFYLENPLQAPKFGSFVGYNNGRKHGIVDTKPGFKPSQTEKNLETSTPEVANSSSEAPTVVLPAQKEEVFETIIPAGVEATVENNANEAEELDKDINKTIGSEIEIALKKQKARLVGIIHHRNNLAEASYVTKRKTSRNEFSPGRLTNFLHYANKPFRALVGIISPSYAINRNLYENHVSFAQRAKAEAKNLLQNDVQSISDSYEVLADYVKDKFGSEFAFNADNDAEVETFMKDCLHTPESPHYKAVMAITKARVQHRITEYNAEIARITEVAGSAKHKEIENEILAESKLLRIKKNVGKFFGDLKHDISDAWSRFTGRKPAIKVLSTESDKRVIPTVLGNAVAFGFGDKAYLRDMKTEELLKLNQKPSSKAKKAGFLLAATAAIASLVGGGVMIKKSLNKPESTNKALSGGTDLGKAIIPTNADPIATAPVGTKISASASSGSAASKPSEAKKDTSDIKKAAISVGTSKSKLSTSTGTSKAKTTVSKLDGTSKYDSKEAPKPKDEKIVKKAVENLALSQAMLDEELAFGTKKVNMYMQAMEEITAPVKLVDGKPVAYNPDLEPLNALLEKILTAHKTMKFRKDVPVLHGLYEQADTVIAGLQKDRNALFGPSFIVETEMNVGMARKSLARIKALKALKGAKFQVVIPVKKSKAALDEKNVDSSTVDRLIDIDLDEIEKSLDYLYLEAHKGVFPNQKRADWMVARSKHNLQSMNFAEYYLTHDISKVRF